MNYPSADSITKTSFYLVLAGAAAFMAAASYVLLSPAPPAQTATAAAPAPVASTAVASSR